MFKYLRTYLYINGFLGPEHSGNHAGPIPGHPPPAGGAGGGSPLLVARNHDLAA